MSWKKDILSLGNDEVLIVGLSEDDGYRYAVIVTTKKDYTAPVGWYFTRVVRLSGMIKLFMEQRK